MKPLERSEGELSSLLHDLNVGVTFLSSAYFLAKTNHSLRLDSTLIHNRYKAHRFRNNNWLHENVHYCAGTMTIMIGRSLFHCQGLVDLLTAQFGARIVPWEHNQQTVLREYFLGGGVGIFQMPLPVICVVLNMVWKHLDVTLIRASEAKDTIPQHNLLLRFRRTGSFVLKLPLNAASINKKMCYFMYYSQYTFT